MNRKVVAFSRSSTEAPPVRVLSVSVDGSGNVTWIFDTNFTNETVDPVHGLLVNGEEIVSGGLAFEQPNIVVSYPDPPSIDDVWNIPDGNIPELVFVNGGKIVSGQSGNLT